MSNMASIIVQVPGLTKDGKPLFRGILLVQGGGPQEVGRLLLKEYNTLEAAWALIDGGGIEKLGAHRHVQRISYNVETYLATAPQGLIKTVEEIGGKHHYCLFTDPSQKWYWKPEHQNGWNPLREEDCK